VNDFYETYAYAKTPLTIFVFMFGACIGSFLNVVIWRVPLGESIVTAPSHCPKCQANIPWYYNIPILAWLALGGKCRSCKAPISPRYIIVEALTGVLILAVWFRAWSTYDGPGDTAVMPVSRMLMFMFIISMLIAMTYIDFDHMIVIDGMMLVSLIVALAFAMISPAAYEIASAPMHMDNLRHKSMLFHSFASLAVVQWNELLLHPRLLVLLDMLLGVIFGGGILWLFAEGGKVLFGRRRHRFDEPILMRLDAKGFETEDEGEIPWEDVIIRDSDVMVIQGEVSAIQWKPLGKKLQMQPSFDLNHPIEISCDGEFVHFEHDAVHLDHIKELQIRTADWVEPREGMGMGDVILLGVLGAFLGAGASIFILCVSSILGSIGGGIMSLLGKTKFYRPIPFGPYIALAAVIYMLVGSELIFLYGSQMIRLLYPEAQ